MKIRCDYCGNYLDDADEKCQYCGAPNKGIRRTGNKVPKTVEELKQWYIDMHLPDENTTRFFIGRDYAGPKAYGIYKQSDGDFVVYKNKSDGTRMTRYVGKDEAYAVQELYLKIKEEMERQKNTSKLYTPQQRSYTNTTNKRTGNNNSAIIIIIIIVIIALAIFSSRGSYYGGYNNYDSSYNSSYDSWNGGFWDSSSSSYNSSYDSDWDSGWDSDWDSSSDWDSDWSSWDSDW